MTAMSRSDLKALLEATRGQCVSVYLPTVRAGQETQQNPIRFKNLLREVDKQLAEQGWERSEVGEYLEPLRDLLEDHAFWQHQQDGLAVFRADGFFEHYRLPVAFEELATVNDHFYLKPLFSLFRGDGQFYVLTLSINNIRLLEASRYRIREIPLGDEVPKSLTDALGFELEEKHIQYHTGTSTSAPGGGPVRSPVYHGQGGGEEDQKPEIRKFFRRVDQGIHERLVDKSAPLILAGVDYLLPLYREASEHRNLLEEGLPGNADNTRPEELHERSWEIARPVLLAQREEAVERFQNLLGTGLASSQVDEVVTAAFDGRVDTLFVDQEDHRWGRFDPQERRVEAYEDPRPGSDDLLDLAAVRTFMNGGTVYALDEDKLPETARPLAAIFRY